MPQQRAPRTLRDVSHLFLSGGVSSSTRAARRSEALVWIIAVGRSVNRAHLAAGTASACVELGMCVSLIEMSRGLPNVGYYFGMEPADYLAPVVDRTALMSGTWEAGVQFYFSGVLSSLAPCLPGPTERQAPHVVLAACPCPPAGVEARFFDELSRVSTAFSDRVRGERLFPDCIIIAGGAAEASRASGLKSRLDAVSPQSVFVSLSSGPDCRGSIEAEERMTLPGDLRSTWARRTPPEHRFFGEMVASVFQILSLRRRRVVGHAAGV
jgi:hypothetical protein